MDKKNYLKEKLEHVDIKSFNSIPLIDQYAKMAFQARNLARASRIYDKMLAEKDCTIMLCLAGSLISAGLRKAIYDLVDCNMVDAIVSTGANIVDQDFFEGLGFRHYIGTPMVDDDDLMSKKIDRIYDTYIDEDELRICDETVGQIADSLKPQPYSSQQFIVEMGKYLKENGKGEGSIVRKSFEKGVPIFCPAFSDCSAGFGLVHHQNKNRGKKMVTLDSAKDFLDLTRIKIASPVSGLLMLGGGVPKNFAQDTVVAAEVLGHGDVSLHKYAVQITVADERDGGLSGSTLKEAHSWGKVDQGNEQMVFAEATIAFPLLASYAYHKGSWKNRKEKNFNSFLEKQ